MNKWFGLGFGVLGCLLVPLLSYGTLSPCGMLRKELKMKMLDGLEANKSGWQALGSALGVGLGSNIVDGMVDALSPMQCVRTVVRVKFSGESPFGDAQSDSRKTNTMRELLPGWQFSTEKSPMDDSTSVMIYRYAEKPVQGWLEKSEPTLVLRCVERKTHVYVNSMMQLQTDHGEYNQISVRLRFDRKPARSEKFLKSTDGKGAFAQRPVPLIKEMLAHESLAFEFTPFNAGSVVADFDLKGLDAKIGDLRKACNW